MPLTLAIETATAACSVALLDGARVIESRHEIVGRGHAERLVPMIGEVLGATRPGLILVDCGPGSFTGVRVGLAAARAMALGWGIEVRGFSSLALLAAKAGGDVAAAIPGGHGELFVQRFGRDPLAPRGPFAGLASEAAASFVAGDRVVGPGAAIIARLRGEQEPEPAWPDAADAALLPLALAARAPSPLYGRAPDAKMPA